MPIEIKTPLVTFGVTTIPHYSGYFVVRYVGGYPKDSSREYPTLREAQVALLNAPVLDYGS